MGTWAACSGARFHMNAAVSVIVTTFNWPEALAEVLLGLARQHVAPLEVLVADDGSDHRTAHLVQSLALQLPYPLKHVWQEHQGFRAARGRNRAAALAQGQYLVFLDGDCVPLAGFVSGHLRLAQARRFIAGQRILLSRNGTEQWLVHGKTWHDAGWMQWLRGRHSGDINRLAPLLNLPDGRWRQRMPSRWEGVKTCNLGLWRSDFLAVNGFDETFVGWGHEDADLAVRLIRHGVSRKDGRFAAPVLHLWHPPAARGQESGNRALLDQTLAGVRPVVAELGLSQHLPA